MSTQGPNPARTARDRYLTGISLVLLAIWMSTRGHHPGGVIVGAALTLAATLGLFGLLGDSPLDLRGDERPVGEGDARPWWLREGALVVLFGALLYLPLAGAFGLWDPWETHYEEVAREVLARDDWITLWWAQEGWFMSKPILVFWLGALGMGVGTILGPLQGIHADAGPGLHEWFIRVPICALSIAALYALYRAVASAWSKRAGMLAAMVLATMPQWFFLTHQAMTDMPFVAPLVLAVSALALALTSDPDALAEPFSLRVGGLTLRLSLWHLAVGLLLVATIPQITYLLTRPLRFDCPSDANAAQCSAMLAANRAGGVQLPVETFFLGSADNSALTDAATAQGSPRWERLASAVPFFPSLLQGLVWLSLLVPALRTLERDRRRQTLHYVMFYFWCAVSTLGKGPGGVAIPGAIALLHFATSGRWRDLLRIRISLGLVVFAVVCMPWYVAITGRLGSEFPDRFVRHDLINRMTVGVHGDTGSLRYFLWQLGYAMFPWTGLVPVAFAGWRFLVPEGATERQRDIARLGVLWFTVGFTLFSAITTKFHHYILPAVPGAALVVGLLLDRLLGPSTAHTAAWKDQARTLAAQCLALAVAVVGAANLMGSFSGVVPRDGVVRASPGLGLALLAVAAVVWWRGLAMHRDATPVDVEAPESDPKNYREREYRPADAHTPSALAAAAPLGALSLGAAAVVAMVARDLSTSRGTPPGSMRLIHLFVYNYDRPWPARWLDYRAALFGFGAVAVALLVAVAAPRVRAYAARGIVALAALFALWGLDVYMIQVTPHWSQRPLFARYYAMRARSDADPRYRYDPVIAHQMNWKGENFYTGNRAVAEECGLKYCTGSTAEFVRGYRGRRLFVVTEHSRLSGLLSTLRTAGWEGRAVTTEADNNKFLLVEATSSGAPAGADPTRWSPTEAR